MRYAKQMPLKDDFYQRIPLYDPIDCLRSSFSLEVIMSSLLVDYPTLLRAEHGHPRLSVYMPTHRRHPERMQDPIRFRNLIRTLEQEVAVGRPEALVRGLMDPLHVLAEDHEFWTKTLDGLAVLRAPEEFRVYRLQRPVPEIAVVSERYLTKPLMRIMQSADRYQILALTRDHVRMFEGDRDTLDEIPLAKGVPATLQDALGTEIGEPHMTMASFGGGGALRHGHSTKADEDELDTERYFRAVDKAVFDLHSNATRLPLILAALPEHTAVFRKVTHSPLLMPEHIVGNPDVMDTDTLRTRAWEVMEPMYLARLAHLVDTFNEGFAKGLGSDDVIAVAKAAAAGRVGTMLVDANKRVPGRIADDAGHVEFDDLHRPTHGDILDDLGEFVLRHGGDVVVVPAERMPTQTGVAAVYRY